MRRTTKIGLITAASLVLFGCVLFAGVMTTVGWDLAKLSTVQYETNTYEVGEPFGDISLTTDTAEIVFALSGEGKCRVECREEKNARHSVAVENGTLTVKISNRRSWYDYIGFHFGSPKITVFLPDTEYAALTIRESTGNVDIPEDFTFAGADISASTGNVRFFAAARESVGIRTNTGDIRVESISAGSLDLSVATGTVMVADVTCQGEIAVGVSTGKAALTDVSCRSITSDGTTGDITLYHVIAAGRLSVGRSTGNVRFTGCDAAELYVNTTTGNVTGSLLTDKVLITDTRTGRVNVPQATSGGRCEIRTTTGDIQIEIE